MDVFNKSFLHNLDYRKNYITGSFIISEFEETHVLDRIDLKIEHRVLKCLFL